VSDEQQLAAVFFALSDGQRRRVLQEVARRPEATVTEICNAFAVSRFAIMRHLNVLEEAGLIEREAVGRERRVRLTDWKFEDAIQSWMRQQRGEI